MSCIFYINYSTFKGISILKYIIIYANLNRMMKRLNKDSPALINTNTVIELVIYKFENKFIFYISKISE